MSHLFFNIERASLVFREASFCYRSVATSVTLLPLKHELLASGIQQVPIVIVTRVRLLILHLPMPLVGDSLPNIIVPQHASLPFAGDRCKLPNLELQSGPGGIKNCSDCLW
jgi:hypothetical protein